MITGQGSKVHVAVVGAFVLAGTILNLLAIPHPTWFALSAVLTVIAAVPLTVLLSRLIVTTAADALRESR